MYKLYNVMYSLCACAEASGFAHALFASHTDASEYKSSYPHALTHRSCVSKMIILTTLVLCKLIVTGSSVVGSCETTSAPRHVGAHCRIQDGRCGRNTANGVQTHTCDDTIPCPVRAGMPLDISCSDGDSDLTLYRGNLSFGSYTASWPFAVSSTVEGVYECRWSNGSLYANRSVNVDGK